MLNFSPEKLLLVGIIALVVLGPSRLPQAARSLGRVIGEVRKVSGSFQSEVRDALSEPRSAISSAIGELGITDVRTSLRSALSDAVSPFSEAVKGTAPLPTDAGASAAKPGPVAPQPVPDDPSLN